MVLTGIPVGPQLRAKLEEQRKLLLDLGARSKLINFKHKSTSAKSKKQNFLRIVDEIPELIIEKLNKEGRFQLIAKPAEDEYQVDLTELDNLKKADVVVLAVPHDDFVEHGWKLISELLQPKGGIVYDVKSVLDKNTIPENINLFRL